MKSLRIAHGVGVFLVLILISQVAFAAPPCKGPNKNDPGCPGAEEPPPPADALVESATVDWLNQHIVIRGSGFTGSTEFLLGGNATPLATGSVANTEVELPFDANLASEVLTEGSYKLVVDGNLALSVYIESQIIDPAATGCPCETDWATELGGLWGVPQTTCFEIEGPGANDAADISGTVLSDPLDSAEYPHYPIGASFYPGAPADSYCALVEVQADATLTELVRYPINEVQQAECAVVLTTNVCTP